MNFVRILFWILFAFSTLFDSIDWIDLQAWRRFIEHGYNWRGSFTIEFTRTLVIRYPLNHCCPSSLSSFIVLTSRCLRPTYVLTFVTNFWLSKLLGLLQRKAFLSRLLQWESLAIATLCCESQNFLSSHRSISSVVKTVPPHDGAKMEMARPAWPNMQRHGKFSYNNIFPIVSYYYHNIRSLKKRLSIPYAWGFVVNMFLFWLVFLLIWSPRLRCHNTSNCLFT